VISGPVPTIQRWGEAEAAWGRNDRLVAIALPVRQASASGACQRSPVCGMSRSTTDRCKPVDLPRMPRSERDRPEAEAHVGRGPQRPAPEGSIAGSTHLNRPDQSVCIGKLRPPSYRRQVFTAQPIWPVSARPRRLALVEHLDRRITRVYQQVVSSVCTRVVPPVCTTPSSIRVYYCNITRVYRGFGGNVHK
jgi:hypothetical protein